MDVLWVMLADMVPFNTKMQQRASNSLHNLGAMWEPTAVSKSIATIRAEIRVAREMGVNPGYALCVKPLLIVMENTGGDGSIVIMGLNTSDMITDIGTKACTKEEFERLLLPMKGHEAWKISKPRHTMTFT